MKPSRKVAVPVHCLSQHAPPSCGDQLKAVQYATPAIEAAACLDAPETATALDDHGEPLQVIQARVLHL